MVYALPFSGTYSVQSAKFENLTNSVNVTCIFAINATASACWIVFINSSLGLTFDGLIQHFLPMSTGLIDIPKTISQHEVVQQLGSVAFDAKVYDMSVDGNVTGYPAFEQGQAFVVETIPLNPDLSPSIIGNRIVLSVYQALYLYNCFDLYLHLVSSSTTVMFQPTSPVRENCM